MTAASPRITSSAGVALVSVPVLSKNVIHLIGAHNTTAEIAGMLFQIYGTGNRLSLKVTLKSGHEIRVQITSFKFVASDNLEFEGRIANGSKWDKVKGTFRGTNSGGSLQIVD
ncbi:MAG: hypothetical protein HZB75_04870 [Candidatus Saccharibacteria bacterium]|nr:MAG: hypothetical protein HZB75_04870 [Candidatus Saccharibacteria bacterium]